jgi:hypothetical protein
VAARTEGARRRTVIERAPVNVAWLGKLGREWLMICTTKQQCDRQ